MLAPPCARTRVQRPEGTLRTHQSGDQVADRTVSVIPGWLSILPPLIAIALAIIFRQVILALLAGVWVGALFTSDFNPLLALLHTADKYGAEALADSDHASIIVFTLLLGGMIGVIGRSGGARGLADVVTNLPPYVALVLATSGIRIWKRVRILGYGCAILIATHMLFFIVRFTQNQMVQKTWGLFIVMNHVM